MTSKLTRERLEEIRDYDTCVTLDESAELARMALAAMDSEPNRNPVLPYADSYRDMAKQGVESVPIWSVITDLERNIAPLYRHAQPVPVVPDDVLDALQKVARIRLELNDFDGDCRGIADCLGDAEEALIEVVNRRAAMLQELQKSAGAANNCRSNKNVQDLQDESRCGIKSAPPLDFLPKNSESRGSNSPVIPDGYVMVPMRLTAENGAKGVLSGEFSETQFVNCPECFGDDECETCDGSGRIEIKVPVSWTTIKDIWIKGVEHFAAAPQENN
ncbi:MAG: hypothetical protein E7G14_05860 [Klebsiella michiganensis]|nr:hypothetical protein [Klebsiella michiganensis]MDU3715326.1 hypothetical protein [Klebsiella michiganensis]